MEGEGKVGVDSGVGVSSWRGQAVAGGRHGLSLSAPSGASLPCSEQPQQHILAWNSFSGVCPCASNSITGMSAVQRQG